VPQVAPEQVPVEIVRFAAVLALYDEAAYAHRAQQCLVDFQVSEVLKHILSLDLAERVEFGLLARFVKAGGGIGGVSVERVDRLLVHPSTVVPTPPGVVTRCGLYRLPARACDAGAAHWVR
jgi:hypothetical protein